MQTKRKAVVPEVVPGVAKARAKISLTGIKLWSTNIRTLLLNLFFLIIVIVLVPLLIGQFQRNQVFIELIAVPDVLAKRRADTAEHRAAVFDGVRLRTAQGTFTLVRLAGAGCGLGRCRLDCTS